MKPKPKTPTKRTPRQWARLNADNVYKWIKVTLSDEELEELFYS